MPANARSGATHSSKKTLRTRKMASSTPVVRKSTRKPRKQSTLFTFTHEHLIRVMVLLALIVVAFVGYIVTASSNAATAKGAIVGTGGNCLDNKWARVADKNKIQTYNCNETKAQQWVAHSDGSLRVQGYCLDIPGASKRVATRVQLYRCNGTVAQKWQLKNDGTIVNPHSKLCLDVRYNNTQPQAVVQIYTCNGTAAQKWTVPSTQSSKPPVTTQPTPAPAPANPAPQPPADSASKDGDLVWSDEFNGSSVNTANWKVVNQTRSTESHHQGRYLSTNVAVSGGNLRILTERHCVRSGDLPSTSNRSTTPCPSGTSTQYSSGQVRTPYNWKSGKMEIRAKLSKTSQSGLWSGFWLRQQGAWCTPEYGEIDILEWYSDPKSTNASTATTHISCANDKLKSRQHFERVSGTLADSWHVWGVEWDKTGVTYYLDGKVVESIASHRPDDDNQNKDTYSDYDGISKAQFESIMDRPWHLRINTQVYPTTDKWHEAPDNSVNFSPQTFLVDYVRVYR